MARKNTLSTRLLKNQSLSSSFITPPTIIMQADNVSYQINVTTSNSTGSFQVQVSDDYSTPQISGITNAGTWTTLTLSGGTPTVAAANDTISISLNQLPFYAVRLVYNSTVAGTGICDVYITSKQLGG
jgi:hypothetical protein